MFNRINFDIFDFDKFIANYKGLGYTADEEGLCNGLSVGLMLALLADIASPSFNGTFPETEKFLARLIDISETTDIQQHIAAARQNKNQTEEDMRWLEIPAGCDAIELAQNTECYSQFFGQGISQSNVQKVSAFIASRKIEQAGGVCRVYTETIINDQDVLFDYLNDLSKRLNDYHVFLMSTPDHIILICKTPNGWMLFDLQENTIYISPVSTEQLVKDIMIAFNQSEKSVINISLYTTQNRNDKILRKSLCKFKRDNLSKLNQIYKTPCSDLDLAPIIMAVMQGDIEHVKREIQLGINVNQRFSDHHTLLTFAADENRSEIAAYLIREGADIYAKGAHGYNALHFAIENGNLKLVKMLFKHNALLKNGNKAFANRPSKDGETPIYLAAKHGWVKLMAYLVKQGASMDDAIKGGDILLFAAASAKHFHVVKYIIEEKLKKQKDVKKLINTANKDGNTSYTIAADINAVPMMHYLSKHGADIYIKNKQGNLPLHLAAFGGHLEAVKFILEDEVQCKESRDNMIKQANIFGLNTFHLACRKGTVQLLAYLIDQGAHITKKTPIKNTPLHIAALNGNLGATQFLIEKYAAISFNVDETNMCGETALWLAAEKGHASVVELLSTQGAKPNLKNKNGNSPLCIAVKNNHVDVVNTLINKGANINLKNKKFQSPLMIAFQNNNTAIASLLIIHGARVDDINLAYKTPQDDHARNDLFFQELCKSKEVRDKLMNNIAFQQQLIKIHPSLAVFFQSSQTQESHFSNNPYTLYQPINCENENDKSPESCSNLTSNEESQTGLNQGNMVN